MENIEHKMKRLIQYYKRITGSSDPVKIAESAGIRIAIVPLRQHKIIHKRQHFSTYLIHTKKNFWFIDTRFFTVSTDLEWEALTFIKDILKDTLNTEDITHKQTGSYLAILYKNNTWKWICRINLYSSQKTLILPDENKREQKHPIEKINDIRNYATDIITVTKRYLDLTSSEKNPDYLYTKWGVYEMPEPYKINLQRGPRHDLKTVSYYKH
ncbi:MAG: hypothetical protein HFH75_07965 [Lachnospiraceae bacterium]|nr:hypothetical protein [Lachnospiraceae bacterium]